MCLASPRSSPLRGGRPSRGRAGGNARLELALDRPKRPVLTLTLIPRAPGRSRTASPSLEGRYLATAPQARLYEIRGGESHKKRRRDKRAQEGAGQDPPHEKVRRWKNASRNEDNDFYGPDARDPPHDRHGRPWPMAASDETPASTKGVVPCSIANQLTRELAFHKVFLLRISCTDDNDGSVDSRTSPASNHHPHPRVGGSRKSD